MNFCRTYEKHQKKKMNMVFLVYTSIFLSAIFLALYVTLSYTSEVRVLVWFVVGLLGIVEAILLAMWTDYRTWMLSKSGESISFCNRFRKMKEIQVNNIPRIYVNKYAKIRIYGENGKVFLERNLSEYPGMYELMLALKDKDSIFEFENDLTKEHFLEALEIVERNYIK